MAQVVFTANLRRHVPTPKVEAAGGTVREVLDAVFERHPALRGYVLDDQRRLRKHVSVFIAGAQVADREGLTDPVPAEAEIWVMQALSGG